MTTKLDTIFTQLQNGFKHAEQAIEDLLREKGIVPTRQRVEIAQVLLEKHQHLSADQLQSRLAEKGGFEPSRATVYNTLRLFADHGLIREVVVDPQRVFFDSRKSIVKIIPIEKKTAFEKSV